MGSALLAPVSADPGFTVTFSNGSVYVQQSQSQNSYGQTAYGQWQVNQGQCPNNPPQYSTEAYDAYDPYQGYQNQTVWQPVEPVVQQPATSGSALATEVLRLTNQERARQGLAPLAHHTALASAASGHSQEMLDLGYFSHTSPTPGRSGPQDRVRLAGVNPGLVAENIFQASGYDVAQVAQLAVDNWLQSPGHRRNMLDPSATHLGVGFASQDGTVAVTQIFGNRL